MTRICIFGDSITYGAWDKEGGWVQKLRKFLDKKNLSDSNFYCLVYNLGISGDTTEDLLERFEFELKQRLKEGEEIIIVFDIGVNDSQFLHDKKELRTNPEKFKENIQKLTDLAKKFSQKIVFVGLTPVDESKTNPIPWDTNKSYKNEYIEKYNQIIKSVCEENDVPFIEIFNNLRKLDYKNLLENGLHPNSEGHRKIFKTVKKYLIENKII